MLGAMLEVMLGAMHKQCLNHARHHHLYQLTTSPAKTKNYIDYIDTCVCARRGYLWAI